jgi:hypothetical protein
MTSQQKITNVSVNLHWVLKQQSFSSALPGSLLTARYLRWRHLLQYSVRAVKFQGETEKTTALGG